MGFFISWQRKIDKNSPILEKNNLLVKADGMHPYKSALIFIDTLLDKKLIKIEQKKIFLNIKWITTYI